MAITQKKLHKLFDYNPVTGIFIRKTESSHNVHIGDTAGSLDVRGYLVTRIDNKLFYLHRLAWLYVHGDMPENEIDHKNHCRADNRICNLREATRREQTQNSSLRNDNTSGVVGVSWHTKNKRWRARIHVCGKDIPLGCFVNFHEAVNARKNAEILYGFHENHGGVSSQ